MHADDNDNDNFLFHESRKLLEQCARLRRQSQAIMDEQGEKQVMNLLELMDKMQRGRRAASNENAQLRELNGRLKRQIENFETALAEAHDQNQRLNSQHAADQALIAGLQRELDQYKERFNQARTELQNAAIAKQPPVQRMVKMLAPRAAPDEDTQDDDDNAFSFSAQQLANQSSGDVLLMNYGGGGRVGKRRSNSLDVLPDKKAKQLMGHQVFTQDSMERLAEEDDVMTVRGLGVRGLKCNDCKLQIHESCRSNALFPCVPMSSTTQRNNPKQRPRLPDLYHNQLTPVSSRPRRIPVRIGGTPMGASNPPRSLGAFLMANSPAAAFAAPSKAADGTSTKIPQKQKQMVEHYLGPIRPSRNLGDGPTLGKFY